jgi:tetratricopeptide (TPR) repeat protein/GGDEF domain-containing protein
VISPLLPVDDFARQLAPDELARMADQLLPHRELILCSAVPDGAESLRTALGDARMDALLRELTLFVRRNLRGGDAIAAMGDELLLMFDASALLAGAVANRILAAVRGHVFSAGAADRSVRLSLAIGVAPSTGRADLTAESLLVAARAARRLVVADGFQLARGPVRPDLDLGRFVGRVEEVARFTDYLDDMVRGVGRVVAVIGERGIGASSLVHALQPEVRLRGGSLVIGSCHDHVLPRPYGVWGEVLRGVRRLPVKSTRAWRELPALDPTLEGAARETSGGSKTRLLEELADFLRLAAQQRPLLLLLENLQWADVASWDALEYLIGQLESERIMIALTFGTDTASDDALERWNRLASRPRHHAMRLTGLTRDDVKRWLEGAMRTSEAGRELLAYLYRQTEGNPLQLTQLIRDLRESDFIMPTDDGWQWRSVAEFPVLAQLDVVIGRRLRRLPPAARSLLEAVAVLGRATVEPLAAQMAGLDPEAGREALRHLLAVGMLDSSHDRDRTTCILGHDEIGRVAREQLAPDRRRALESRIASVLARDGSGAAVEIAEHFEHAGEPAEAHRFALAGADEALALHEMTSVAQLLAAAERTAPDPAALAEVRMRMAAIAELAGRFEEAEVLCDHALEWYVGQGDRLGAIKVKRTRSLVRTKRGQQASESLTELLALEEEAAAAGADMERAAVLLLVAQMHWRLGDVRAAQRCGEEAVAIAEQGTDQTLLADACNRLAATLPPEARERSRQLFARSLEIATALGDPFRQLRGLNNIGVQELLASNWDAARRALTMASEQARTAGLVESWGRAELNLGVLAARVGDDEAAARALSESLRLTAMVQLGEEQLYATYNMAHLDRVRERYREAIDLYELVTELAERIGQVAVQAGAIAGMGLCSYLAGDLAAARLSFAAASPLMERLLEWFQGRELIVALELNLALEDGRTEPACRLFDEALHLAAPSDTYGAAWLTAEFAGVLHDGAPAVIEAAVARYQDVPEVVGNPRIRDRFAVLKFDSKVTIDRIE